MMGVQHKVVGIGAGVAGAILIVNGQGEQLGSLVAFTSVIGAMLPDIDHDRTKIGRKRKFITNLSGNALTILASAASIILILAIAGMVSGVLAAGINWDRLGTGAAIIMCVDIARKRIANSKNFKWMTKHRGLMHTLVPMIGIYLLMTVTPNKIWYYSLFGILIGYGSHLFADMLTVEGCPILFPLSKSNFRFLKLSTKSNSCWLAAFGAAALFVYLALKITQLR